jgi:hypothetical protein
VLSQQTPVRYKRHNSSGRALFTGCSEYFSSGTRGLFRRNASGGAI